MLQKLVYKASDMDTQEKQQNEIMAEKFFSDLAEIRTIKKFDELNPILNEKSELFIKEFSSGIPAGKE